MPRNLFVFPYFFVWLTVFYLAGSLVVRGELLPLNNREVTPAVSAHGVATTVGDWTLATADPAEATTFVVGDRTRRLALRSGAAISQEFVVPETRKNSDGSERAPRADYFGLLAIDLHGVAVAGAGNVTVTLRDVAAGADVLSEVLLTSDLAVSSAWSVHSFSSEGSSDLAAASIDRDAGSHWLSDYEDSPDEHFIVFDLGVSQPLDGIVLKPRQSWTSGIMTDYQVRVSDDPTNFSAPPVSAGTFWYPNQRYDRRVEFGAGVSGRYVRVSNTEDLVDDGQVRAAIAEFTLLGEKPASSDRRWLYLPNSVIDGLDGKTLELKIAVASITPVVVGRVDLVRLHKNPGSSLFGKANGVSGPDLLSPGAYGFEAMTEDHHRSVTVTGVLAGGAASAAGLQVGDVLVACDGETFGDNSVNPGWEWFDYSVEWALSRAAEEAYAPGTAAVDLGKVSLTVLRPGALAAVEHAIEIQLPLPAGVAGMVPDSGNAAFASLYADVISHVAAAQESSGKWPGNEMRTWPAALALLGSNDPQYAGQIYAAANYLLNQYVVGENYDSFFYHGVRAMFMAEYYRASGDERARRWLEETFEWAPTVAHVNARGHLSLGHGATGLPYGEKSLMAPLSHLLAAEGVCVDAGITDGSLFDTCSEFIQDSWSDPATGGHGGMGYNFSYRDLGEFWSRSGLTALALQLRDENPTMRDALLRVMSDRHAWMRNSHAYGEPGAALGLMAFAVSQPAEFERLFEAWRPNYLMHWRPGYGLTFSTPHMGAPYMEGDLLMNAVYGMLWSYADGGLYLTGGDPGQWLTLPADPQRDLELVVDRSATGVVTLTCDKEGSEIYVTTDGTQPTRGSLAYRLPFAAQQGMKVCARAYDPVSGEWGSKIELGEIGRMGSVEVLSATGFADSSIAINRAERAFDGNTSVSWMTNNGLGRVDFPHEVVIDLGAEATLASLTLHLDRSGSAPNEVHAFTSADGLVWAPDLTPDQSWTIASYSDESRLNFSAPVQTRFLKLRFPSSFDGVASYMNIREITFGGIAPVITVDAASGIVSMSAPPAGAVLRYTVDGSLPTASSPLYDMPFTVGGEGGLVQARLFVGGEPHGALAIATVPGDNNRTNYTVTVSSQQGGAGPSAVDGDPGTIWHSQWNLDHPHDITLDLGEQKTFHGFYYKPRSGAGNGTIDGFEVYVSDDGIDFGTPVMTGSYTALGMTGDAVRTVRFDAVMQSRYLRVRSLSEQHGGIFFSASELGVVELPFHPRETQDALSLNFAEWSELFDGAADDGDEHAALLEYFLGTDPTQIEAVPAIVSWLETIDESDYFAFSVQRDTRAQVAGDGMLSTDLQSWQSVADAETEGSIHKMTVAHGADGIETTTYRSTATTGGVPRFFFKVSAAVSASE